MTDSLSGRVTELEQRVRDLESRGAPTLVDATGDRDPSGSWALEGVRRSYDSPGGVVLAGVVELGDGQYEWHEQHPTAELISQDDGLLDAAADALAALGHPARLALLAQVLTGRTEASELVKLEQFGTSGQVYHHAKTLIAAGWLRQAGRGRYLVPVERIVPLLVALAVGRSSH